MEILCVSPFIVYVNLSQYLPQISVRKNCSQYRPHSFHFALYRSRYSAISMIRVLPRLSKCSPIIICNWLQAPWCPGGGTWNRYGYSYDKLRRLSWGFVTCAGRKCYRNRETRRAISSAYCCPIVQGNLITWYSRVPFLAINIVNSVLRL